MHRMRLICLASLAIILYATAAAADEPDPMRGLNLAERWCAKCHVIGPKATGGDAGPAFVTVAGRKGQSADNVRMWLADPHPPMPDFDLTATEYDDLAAYIMSLRDE